MADYSVSDIALFRKRANGADDDPAPTRQPTPRRRRTTPARTRKTKEPERKPARGVDPDERFRQVTGVLLVLGGVLVLLALISYTPHDQANADVRLSDLFGLFTNDPHIAAKADTTENWLGLLGAFVANFLINATVGYATLAVPVLLVMWGVKVFSGKEYQKMWRGTLFTILVMTLVASLFGTVRLVEWLFNPAPEFSGAIGTFIAAVFTGLLGTIGAFLILSVGLFIACVYAFDVNVLDAVAKLRDLALLVWARAKAANESLSQRLSERQPDAVEASKSSEAAVSGDDEPARMARRIRGGDSNERAATPSGASFSEPSIRRSESRPDGPPMPNLSDAPARGSRSATPEAPVEPERDERGRIRNPHRNGSQMPPAEPEMPKPITLEPATARNHDLESVELRRAAGEEPVAVAEPAAPRLTLEVQEGESLDDQEVGDGGELVNVQDEQISYTPPSVDILTPQSEVADVNDDELKENARILQEKLATFNIQIENLTVTPGPVVTLYEFVPAAGIKVAQIESLADDIALALKARGIRIIAPIPGKGTVGVEIPNHKPAMVRIRSVINTARFREASHRLPLALGKTTVGEVFCDDLAKMPHLLIAGATGSGKSVGINSILTSLIYKMHPADLKFVIIDPKKIELSLYRSLKDHFLARCPDVDEEIITNAQNAVTVLKALELEMDRRYDILSKVGQRNIHDYNERVDEGRYKDAKDFTHVRLPYIVLILDELADLMITAAREVEEPIARLAQLARAIGIHLVVATQRPSVDVITGVIKANFPARIAYQVASKIDSRTILDMNGAEQLLGNGDMLYLPGGQPKPLRLQNAFISTDEVEEICDYVGRQRGYSQPYMLPSVVEKKKSMSGGARDERDELFEEAARLVVTHQQGSVSLVQRRLKVGYSRAARIIDELEMAGIVGPFDGSKARQVLVENEEDLEIYI